MLTFSFVVISSLIDASFLYFHISLLIISKWTALSIAKNKLTRHETSKTKTKGKRLLLKQNSIPCELGQRRSYDCWGSRGDISKTLIYENHVNQYSDTCRVNEMSTSNEWSMPVTSNYEKCGYI